MMEAVPLTSQWQPTVLQNAAPSRTQCWCIGSFKNPAVKETCKMPIIQVYSSHTIISIRLLTSSEENTFKCRRYCFGRLGLISAVLMKGWK